MDGILSDIFCFGELRNVLVGVMVNSVRLSVVGVSILVCIVGIIEFYKIMNRVMLCSKIFFCLFKFFGVLDVLVMMKVLCLL